MKLELNGIKKAYGDFNLDCTMVVEEGDITGLIGCNGAGKSTTFKAALGLIKVDDGEVTINGKNVSELTGEDKEDIGVVLADSGFSGYLDVNDVICIMKGMYKNFNKAEFTAKCKELSIPLNKKIMDFSTGMKAKLKILVAMSHKAKLLILDEPTSGLDVVARDEILDLLRSYMETEGNSILISSHISGDLEDLCDDIYMINDGKIILHEETNTILDEYGVIKVTKEQYEKLDMQCVIARKQENFGYSLLTGNRQFYLENYPEISVEKGSVDSVITMMVAR